MIGVAQYILAAARPKPSRSHASQHTASKPQQPCRPPGPKGCARGALEAFLLAR
eukprot:COSAG06_NODE_488_length_15101_cov_1080.380683_7_plen_54_part_00